MTPSEKNIKRKHKGRMGMLLLVLICVASVVILSPLSANAQTAKESSVDVERRNRYEKAKREREAMEDKILKKQGTSREQMRKENEKREKREKLKTEGLQSARANLKNYDKVATQSVNAFSVELFNELAKKQKNLFVSPYSVSSALAMCYLGAGGTTAKEMERVLHFNSTIHPSFATVQKYINTIPSDIATVEVANALWPSVEMKLKPQYTQDVKKHYRTPIERLDYDKNPGKSAQTINAWTDKKTRGKIKNIVRAEDFNAGTALVLTNAVYFRSKWQNEFPKSATQTKPFFMENGKKTSVPLMHQRGHFAYFDAGYARLLSLPYERGVFDMVVMLPKEGTTLTQMMKQLTPQGLEKHLASLQSKEALVYMPKFKQEQTLELEDTLYAMGMKQAFSGSDAGFKNIGTMRNRPPYISKVRHKTYIDVGEKETEAAAVTAVMMGDKISPGPRREPPKPIIFRADRPFLYLIRDSATGMILFIGRYMEPNPVKK